MPRNGGGGYTYDPKTGSWVPVSPGVGEIPDFEDDDNTGDEVPDEFTDNDTQTQVDSQGEAEKQYIETEFNTLTGELVVIPSKKAIRIKVNDTVEVLGIGKYLSGKYFVSGVKRTISKDDGYSQTLTLLKNGFGDSLKQATTSSDTPTESRGEKVDKNASPFKVGDIVKIVGDNAIYSNAHEGVKVPAWVKEQTLTVQQVSSDGARVLLMPIYSWTYTTFVQKV